MTETYIVLKPKRYTRLKYADLADESGSEWSNKAKNLRLRRIRALRKSRRELSRKYF